MRQQKDSSRRDGQEEVTQKNCIMNTTRLDNFVAGYFFWSSLPFFADDREWRETSSYKFIMLSVLYFVYAFNWLNVDINNCSFRRTLDSWIYISTPESTKLHFHVPRCFKSHRKKAHKKEQFWWFFFVLLLSSTYISWCNKCQTIMWIIYQVIITASFHAFVCVCQHGAFFQKDESNYIKFVVIAIKKTFWWANDRYESVYASCVMMCVQCSELRLRKKQEEFISEIY
jgi:hypothetical protein